MKDFVLLLLACSWLGTLTGQKAALTGTINTGEGPLPFANVLLTGPELSRGTIADEEGSFTMTQLPEGSFTLTISRLGYQTTTQDITLQEGQTLSLAIILQEDRIDMDEVVVSATRYDIQRKEAPVVVNVLNERIFESTQSMILSESLSFQPGVRVEANCQNCGFTQVRLNGLEGGYAQILINSRPVYSALTSVYGLEQIPTSMIERVEVVRSGGSALYGSNAIAGTINIITKEPVSNRWEVGTNLALIDGTTSDNTINFNGSLVSEDLRSGVTFYGMKRDRDAFDANGDGFSELTLMENNTIGAKAYFRPSEYSKITLDVNAIQEYRRGGDRLELAPHFTDITEELDHNTFIGGLTYDQQSKDRRNNFSAYLSAQTTGRDSYYGGLGGGRTAQDSLTAINAYGTTNDLALVGGLQFSRQFASRDVLTVGLENQFSSVDDVIPGYNRLVDQTVNTIGAYGQYEWKPTADFTALLGLRFDQSTVDGRFDLGDLNRTAEVTANVLSPRLTLLYNLSENLQLRGGYARGFRAPQAFNEDLHISSVGGEPQFVLVSDGLDKETSDAFTASFDYTQTDGLQQLNVLLEGFYTLLNNPFTIVSTGSILENGSILEEVRNGVGAQVAGLNFEVNYSPSGLFLLAAGGTLQQANYREEQILFEPAPGNDQDPVVATDRFIRQPSSYGYFSGSFTPNESFGLDLTGIYTGPMLVPRVISESGLLDIIESVPFMELNLKASYHFDITDAFHLELSGGVQNMLNSFQPQFDRGPQRDSDFVYGPMRPRTFFVGIKIGDFH